MITYVNFSSIIYFMKVNNKCIYVDWITFVNQ